jgi:cytochrome c-type biogenesis protein CcmE
MSDVTGRKTATLTIAVVIVGAIFAYLLFGGLDKNVVFFLTPAELLAKGTDGMDVPVRLGGQVQPGSVAWNAEKLDLRFRVTDTTGKTVVVHSRTAPPQMFRDGMGVVVEGRYNRDGVFESTGLMVKHSNEYRAPKPGESPREMYKSLMKGGAAGGGAS